ncbi:MAG: hypothetical protein OEY13_10780 [Gammaproteobacteria bacterium]|nr:hypothetical protein [Gammaproteobacteria bacterium]MDH4310219.1 hypothetical protein [Gammaproteobacteria bacterium]MDH5273547.1 hypothetical protein [Gammaproteobacteria bacterium]
MKAGLSGWFLTAIAGVVMLGVPAPSEAGSGQGCQFQGSWFGFNSVSGYADWMSAAGGAGHFGNYTLEVVVDAATLKALFPFGEPERHSLFRGNWQRADGNTFEITVIAIVYDTSDQPLGIMQINARDTLDSTCNTMYIEPELKLYLANQDPFEEDPFFEMPLTHHYGHRMSVDPYAE